MIKSISADLLCAAVLSCVNCLQTQSGWTELSSGQNFTQDTVEMNRLWYKHTAGANTPGFKGHDSFRFTLSDLANETPAQSFFISIHTLHKGQRSHRSHRRGRL